MNGYITLDYELFMGKTTGTPEKCLVEPMEQLMDMVDKYNVKMNVFVDAAYLLQVIKLKEEYPQLQRDYEAVVQNVQEIDQRGHAVQLHLHPQWCYSSYDGEKWILDMDHYKLSDMPLDDQIKLVNDGIALLNSLISRPLTAFRAGGYSVENFPELYSTFLAGGIVSDSSAMHGGFSSGKYHAYDFRNIPQKTSYNISKDIKIENPEGRIREFPISTIDTIGIGYLWKKKTMTKKSNRIAGDKTKWGDGQIIGYPGSKVKVLLTKLNLLFNSKPIMASMDDYIYLDDVLQYSKKHYSGDDFIIIGHPKTISPQIINLLEHFIKNHPEFEFKLL